MTLSLELPSTSLPASRWWHRLRSDRDAAIRLWCFPFTGAGAAVWHRYAAALDGAAEIVTACLPGRDGRLHEAPLTRMEDVAFALARELAPVIDERDVFWGHCLGGLIAFEVTRRLEAIGAAGPRALIVSGVRAPHVPAPLPRLHHLAPRDFVAAVERRYGAIPAEFRERPEFLEQLLFTLRADLEMDETYHYHPDAPLEVPILALSGRHDALVSRAALTGWSAHSSANTEVEVLPGGHFFVNEHTAIVSERVRRFLARF